MSQTKKTFGEKLIVLALVAVFAVGSVAIGVATSRIANEFEASILRTKKIPRKKAMLAAKINTSLRRRFVAQAETVPSDGAPLPEPRRVSCMFIPPENPEYKGEFVLREVPVQASQGELFEVSVHLRNTGNVTWFGDASSCRGIPLMRLGTARQRDRMSVFFNPDGRWLGPNRIAMVEPRIEPGEIATFTFTGTAPRVNDIFKEYFQPLVEGVSWLESDDETVDVDIYVGATNQEHEQKRFFLGTSGQASSLDISGDPVIDINLTTQAMKVKLGEVMIREYQVSTGSFNTPTPAGRFKILNKQELRIGNKYPHYRMPYWQGFTERGHGLHSLPYLANDNGVFWNEALNHIGQRVSHGCVRLRDENAKELYLLTEPMVNDLPLKENWGLVTHY